jgi:hypothetical protein
MFSEQNDSTNFDHNIKARQKWSVRVEEDKTNIRLSSAIVSIVVWRDVAIGGRIIIWTFGGILVPVLWNAMIGRADVGGRLHLGSDGVPLIFIHTICVGHDVGRGEGQDIRAQDDFRVGGIKNRKHMGVILIGHFVMPPALWNVHNLSRGSGIREQLPCERIQQRDCDPAGNAIDQLSCVLMIMRLHDIAFTEEYIEQGGFFQRIQLLFAENVDQVISIFCKQVMIVHTSIKLNG